MFPRGVLGESDWRAIHLRALLLLVKSDVIDGNLLEARAHPACGKFCGELKLFMFVMEHL